MVFLRARSYQLFRTIPWRRGLVPVAMVKWPGQVMVFRKG
jgi:hypothetical protein